MNIEQSKPRSLRPLLHRLSVACALALCAMAIPGVASADEGTLGGWEVSGYLRTQLSMNLQNPYLADPAKGGEPRGDYRYDLSMVRGTGRLNLFRDFGKSQVSVVIRGSQEYETDYLKALQRTADEYAASDLFSNRGRSNVRLMNDVYNEIDLRELWWQYEFTSGTTMKLGKQQVVWGETDFFQSMDVIHGYDFRWRSFLEAENEELRKPLWMANFNTRIDKLNGSLQFLYIPGRPNPGDTRGNSYDVEGGRWANTPNRGITFAAAPFGADVPYNYRLDGADRSDDSYGLHWSGTAGEWGYSLGAYRGPSQVPVINPNPNSPLGVQDSASGRSFLGAWNGRYGSDPGSTVGELIFPRISVFGGSVNRYLAGPDVVFSAEASYIPNMTYNVGVLAGEAGGCAFFPGFCGIVERHAVKTMLRFDKQVDLSSLLHTSRPSFLSVQLFNTWVTNYDRADELVNLAGFGGRTKRNSALITGILALNYHNGRINPTLAVGSDLSYGGGFIVPSVEFAYGNHWRIKAEADLFFNRRSQKRALTGFNDTNLFGYFAGNDQLVVRVTYQF
jgi:hypothetical protein